MALTPEMSLYQITRFPVATLKLCLDQYHLPHGGNKKVIAKRLYDHLQATRGTDSSDNNSSDSSNEDSEDGTEQNGSEDGIEGS